jgi:hypothetical protein
VLVTPLGFPLFRELGRSPLLGAIGAVTVPIWYELANGHDDIQTSALLAVVAGGSLLGFAFDDPAQRTLNACALGRTARRVARMLLVAVLLAGSWAIVVAAVAVRNADLGRVSDRLPEVVAAAALASAFAAVGLRNGVVTPGFGAALITVLTMAMSTGMSFWSSRLRWLPQVANPTHATRWWITAAIAAAAACWWARDPAARPFAVGRVRDAANRSASTSRQNH